MEKHGRIINGVIINQRPEHVDNRTFFGHWELDTMVSSRGNSKGRLATFAERKTRILFSVPYKRQE